MSDFDQWGLTPERVRRRVLDAEAEVERLTDLRERDGRSIQELTNEVEPRRRERALWKDQLNKALAEVERLRDEVERAAYEERVRCQAEVERLRADCDLWKMAAHDHETQVERTRDEAQEALHEAHVREVQYQAEVERLRARISDALADLDNDDTQAARASLEGK